MFIYKTTCKENGKIYVGKQVHDYKDYLGGGLLIGYAIRKYGRESFEKEILEVCSSKEELSEREVFWIKKLESYRRDIGYNILTDKQFGNWLLHHPNREQKIEKKKRERRKKLSSFFLYVIVAVFFLLDLKKASLNEKNYFVF
jgi:group I intron endonuclease